MTDQEITLELAIKTWALLPQEARDRMMSSGGKDMAQYVIDTFGHFERHIVFYEILIKRFPLK